MSKDFLGDLYTGSTDWFFNTGGLVGAARGSMELFVEMGLGTL